MTKREIRLNIGVLLVGALFMAGVFGFAGAGAQPFDTFHEMTRILLGDGDCEFSTGAGSPEGVVTGDVCDLFVRTDGGAATTLYIKESGSGNTGWTPTGGAAVTGTGTAGTMTRWQSLGVIEDASMTDADVVTGSTVDTFTNKTFDAEATGNTLTLIDTFNLPVGVCDGPSTTSSQWSFPSGAGAANTACEVGTNTVFMTIDYTDAGTRQAQNLFELPDDFTGTVDAEIVWFSPSTTGSVVWQLATICAGEGDSVDQVFNAASTVTDAAQGVTNTMNEATIANLTVTGCTASEVLFLQLLRDPADGSDDLGDVARLVGLHIDIRRAQ